jgi:hypothetical protein
MRPAAVAAVAAVVGVALGVLLDVLWINLFVGGVGGLLLGVFWMPVIGAALMATRAARSNWTLIACFALTYTPTQFLIRTFVHEPSGRWPINDMLVVLWSNLWFAVIVSAIGIVVWQRWVGPAQVITSDA